MNWYAIQVITGKEQQIVAALQDAGVQIMKPEKPMLFRFPQRLKLESKLLLPGYIIAQLNVTDFYVYQREQRIERMMIRICGDVGGAVPLLKEEVDFLKKCCQGLRPLLLKGGSQDGYEIVNPPPWADAISILGYDGNQFRARVSLKIQGFLSKHSFSIAACQVSYKGFYFNQLQDLLGAGFSATDAAHEQVFIK